MADLERLSAYADWIKANKDKAGTPEFVKVAEAYRQLREQQLAGTSPASAASQRATEAEKERLANRTPLEKYRDDRAERYPSMAPALRTMENVTDAGKRMAVGAATGLFDLGLLPVNAARQYIGGAEPLPTFNDLALNALGIPQMNADASWGQRMAEGVGSAMLQRRLPGNMQTAPTLTSQANKYTPVAGTVASTAAGDAAAQLAMAYRPDDPVLAQAAAIAGGMTPSGANTVANRATRGLLAKPGDESNRAYHDLVDAGITPRPGLVGGKAMARIENTYANVPIVGRFANDRIGQSFSEFQRALESQAEAVGGPLPPNGGATPDVLGARMKASAVRGEENLKQGFDNAYRAVEEGAPGTVVPVPPVQERVAELNSPYSGEAPGVRTALNNFMDTEVHPAAMPFSSYSEYGPVNITNAIPLPVARRVRTQAVYDSNNGTVQGGAVDQVRGAITGSMEEALGRHPNATETPLAQLLAQIDREYAQEMARDVSRASPPSIPPNYPHNTDFSPGQAGSTPVPMGGGAFPALETIQKAGAGDDAKAVPIGSQPGNMAVLQRTDPANYPTIARDTILNKATGDTGYGDIYVSPRVFQSWWNRMGDNERAIYTNEHTAPGPNGEHTPGPIQTNMDRLGRVGQLFRDRGVEANPSGTAPTLATMGLGSMLLYDPMTALGTIGGGLGVGAALSSESLAAYLARAAGENRMNMRNRFMTMPATAAGTGVFQVEQE